MTAPAAVKSAERVLDVLELLARRGAGLSHAGIAAALGIPKSSLTQLLRTLVRRRYLAFDAARKTYGLGEAAVALARPGARGFDIVRLAEPIVAALTRRTDESAALNLPREDEIEVACGANSSLPLLWSMKIGQRAPLYATSGGKVILAHLPRARQRAYLARVRLRRFTAGTLASAAALEKELAEIRSSGVGHSFEEYSPGIVGIAVPVLDAAGAPLASLNVAVPAVRYTPARGEEIAAALKAAAAALLREIAASVQTEPAQTAL
jgi:DNA-binding IclR family transcriptional regulator